MWKTALRSRPNTELALADLAEISASSVSLEEIFDLKHVNHLTKSTAWSLISTVESGADTVFFHGHDLRFLPVDLHLNSRGCGGDRLEYRLKLVETVTKDSYIVHEGNIGLSPPDITDAERGGHGASRSGYGR